MTVKKIGLVLLSVFISACATPKYQSKNVNLSGFPPEYKVGYDDGCSSVKLPLLQKKDSARFKSDQMYAQGWRDGNDMCKQGSK